MIEKAKDGLWKLLSEEGELSGRVNEIVSQMSAIGNWKAKKHQERYKKLEAEKKRIEERYKEINRRRKELKKIIEG